MQCVLYGVYSHKRLACLMSTILSVPSPVMSIQLKRVHVQDGGVERGGAGLQRVRIPNRAGGLGARPAALGARHCLHPRHRSREGACQHLLTVLGCRGGKNSFSQGFFICK